MLSLVMTTPLATPSTQKVRRDVLAGKRADGHRRAQPIRRPDPRRLGLGAPDSSLRGVAGLAPFGAFLADDGLDRALHDAFSAFKDAPSVVSPMTAQLRLLMDAFAAGEARVFGLEALAADPLFIRLVGGVVPSLDTVYRDLARVDEGTVAALKGLMAAQSLRPLGRKLLNEVFLDVNNTVAPLFGPHEGARPGSNPHYPGRPSYHPVLARVAETDTCVGALLRPGDTAFGEADVPVVERLRRAVGLSCVIRMRVDAACDCAALDRLGCWATVKARRTRDLCDAIATLPKGRGRSIDWGADRRGERQVAEVDFARQSWAEVGVRVRVVAVRSRERDNERCVYFFWNDLDLTVQAFLTNDAFSDADAVARQYDACAGIEPLIGE
jgi:Transposase DDE domain group 1